MFQTVERMCKNCPNCGASPDKYENENDKSICSSCGFVVAQAGFTDHAGWVAPTGGCTVGFRRKDQTGFRYGYERKYMATGHKLGRVFIQQLCNVIGCPSSIADESLELFDRVFKHDNCIFRKQRAKDAMAAVCVYITCRKHNWIVTTQTVCEATGCFLKAFNKWKIFIVKAFHIDIQSVDLLDLTRNRCVEAGLSSETLKKTISILELCRDLCVSDSRLYDHLICAASYLAWLSDGRINRKKKVTFKIYCKQHKFKHTHQASVTVNIISGVLCRLAEELPWISKETVCLSNVSMHINDIVQYKATLVSASRTRYLASLMPDEKEGMLPSVEQDSDNMESDDDDDDDGGGSVNESLEIETINSNRVSLRERLSENNLYDVVKLKNHESSSKRRSDETCKPAVNEKKAIVSKFKNDSLHLRNLARADSILFSVKRFKANSSSDDPLMDTCYLPRPELDNTELCEDDLPDSELHHYIKSESELNITSC